MLSHHFLVQNLFDDINVSPILVHNCNVFLNDAKKFKITIFMLKIRVKIYGPSHKLFRQQLNIIFKYIPTPTSDLYSILPHKNNAFEKRNYNVIFSSKL